MSASDVRNLFLVDTDASLKSSEINKPIEKLEEGKPENESVPVVSTFTSSKTNSVENATKLCTLFTQTKEKNMMRHKNNKSNKGDLFVLESNLYESIDSLSVIGFRHCFDSNRTSGNRLLWCILILTSIGVAAFQCCDRISEYLRGPTSTEITVNQSTILNFPQVTICNNNYIKLSAANALELTSYFKQFMPPFFFGPPNASTVRDARKETNQTALVETRKFLSPGYDQKELCMWNKKPCTDGTVTTRFTDFGQCLYIDSRAMNFTITRPGATLGIQLLLNANETDYFIQQTASVGYTVLLHEPDEPPRMTELGFKANLGEAVSVAVSVSKITRLDRSDEPCSTTIGYHPVKCEWRCIAEKIIKQCNCRPIYMEAVGKESICDYFEEHSCATTITDKFYQMRNDDPFSCDCPPLCTETIYTPFVTGSDLSRNFVRVINKSLGPNQTYEEITSNQSMLMIYLSTLQCTYITTTKSYSFVALMSDLGGALGLLLGATFLTIVEAVELIYDFILFISVKRAMAKTSQ